MSVRKSGSEQDSTAPAPFISHSPKDKAAVDRGEVVSCIRETSRRACMGLKPSLTPFAKPHTLECVYHRKEPLHNLSNLSAQRVSLSCNLPGRGPLSTLLGVLYVQGGSAW